MGRAFLAVLIVPALELLPWSYLPLRLVVDYRTCLRSDFWGRACLAVSIVPTSLRRSCLPGLSDRTCPDVLIVPASRFQLSVVPSDQV